MSRADEEVDHPEGAFAWHQGFVLMKNAVNVEQAHEFAKWVSTAEGAALWATAFSSNPVGKGAAELLNPDRPEAPENRRVTIVTTR